MTIGDRVEEVRRLLGNRQDITNRIPVWLQAAILELTENYPFAELVTTGPVRNFTANVSDYNENFAINDGDNKLTRIVAWYVSMTTTLTMGTDTIRVLKYRTPPVVTPMSRVLGMPVRWTRVGSILRVASCPSSNYATYMDYQREHPFSQNLLNDKIMMPNDWLTIVDTVAAYQGAKEVRMTDLVGLYYNSLYGDPKKKGDLGIIQAKVSQRARDSSANERSMQPVVHRYNSR